MPDGIKIEGPSLKKKENKNLYTYTYLHTKKINKIPFNFYKKKTFKTFLKKKNT